MLELGGNITPAGSFQNPKAPVCFIVASGTVVIHSSLWVCIFTVTLLSIVLAIGKIGLLPKKSLASLQLFCCS